ncbi:hypothetical protein BVRB_022750 [Beta vulgaris subsp. vulgaris]|uniref:Uncharacterized protein n=1 Tax=Beta vulgaris subsp. vulgaris TaxID=3555 RepID=A0A0J8AZV9_BETVV|nr:hypothetical protein BVRB_022750 [Beta vulgaris subsp. vulgaris]
MNIGGGTANSVRFERGRHTQTDTAGDVLAPPPPMPTGQQRLEDPSVTVVFSADPGRRPEICEIVVPAPRLPRTRCPLRLYSVVKAFGVLLAGAPYHILAWRSISEGSEELKGHLAAGIAGIM